MATVELRIPPTTAHVRTARLVGVAAAHRAGLAEDLVDELRRALGEACSRAVALHMAHAPNRPVEVVLRDELGRLTIEVTDVGPAPSSHLAPVSALLTDSPGDPDVALAFLAGLVEDVEVMPTDTGTTVRLRWPLLAPVR